MHEDEGVSSTHQGAAWVVQLHSVLHTHSPGL